MSNALRGEFLYLFGRYGPDIAEKYSEGYTRKLHLRVLSDWTGMVGYYNKHGHFDIIFVFKDFDDASKEMRHEVYDYYVETGRAKDAVQWA